MTYTPGGTSTGIIDDSYALLQQLRVPCGEWQLINMWNVSWFSVMYIYIEMRLHLQLLDHVTAVEDGRFMLNSLSGGNARHCGVANIMMTTIR